GFLRSILLGALGLLQLTGWAQEMEVSVAGHSAEAMSNAVFSADEKVMVSEAWGNQLVIWDTSTFHVLTTIQIENPTTNSSSGQWALSPDGRTVVTWSEARHRLSLLNAVNGKEIASWDWPSDHPRNAHLQIARSPVFRADGKVEMIVMDRNDEGRPEPERGRYQLYAVVLDLSLGGALIKELPAPLRLGDGVFVGQLFGNGRYQLAQHDTAFEVFDIGTGKRVAYNIQRKTDDRQLEWLQFGDESAVIVSRTSGKWVVSRFDYASGATINRGTLPIDSECTPLDTRANGRVLLMTTGKQCKDLAVYDLQSLRKIAAIAGAGEGGAVALSSDGRWLAGNSCNDWQKSDESAGCKVFAYDLTAGRMRVEWPVTAESIGGESAIVMSPNGTFVAIGERLMVWNTMSGRQVVPN
ncbi:hypothetical protein, partial [Ralstonia insidiosa]